MFVLFAFFNPSSLVLNAEQNCISYKCATQRMFNAYSTAGLIKDFQTLQNIFRRSTSACCPISVLIIPLVVLPKSIVI